MDGWIYWLMDWLIKVSGKNVLVALGNWDKQYDQMVLRKKASHMLLLHLLHSLAPWSIFRSMHVCMYEEHMFPYPVGIFRGWSAQNKTVWPNTKGHQKTFHVFCSKSFVSFPKCVCTPHPEKQPPPTNPFPSNVLQGQGLINRIELYKLVVRRFHPSEVTTQIIKVKIQIWKGPEPMNKKTVVVLGYIGDEFLLPTQLCRDFST